MRCGAYEYAFVALVMSSVAYWYGERRWVLVGVVSVQGTLAIVILEIRSRVSSEVSSSRLDSRSSLMFWTMPPTAAMVVDFKLCG